MTDELLMRQDSPQIRMPSELNAVHIVGFALGPVGGFPDIDCRIDRGIVTRYRHLQPQAMLVGKRKQVVNDVVPRSPLGEIVNRRHIQQHFEIECRIRFQRAQDLLDVFAFHGDRQIAAKLAHVHQVVRKTLLERRGDRTLQLLILFKKSNEGSRRTLQVVHGRVELRRFQLCLPGMALV